MVDIDKYICYLILRLAISFWVLSAFSISSSLDNEECAMVYREWEMVCKIE